jgi:hypothetical protein
MVRGNDSRAWRARLFLAALVLTFPISRTNTASELTGTVLFLALMKSFELVTMRSCRGWRAALLVGGLIAAVSTLRCPYIFTCAVMGAGFLVWRLRENKQHRKEILREAFLACIVTLLLVSPWWIVTYRSSGAFLYPLFKGTQQPTFKLISNSLSFVGTLEFIGTFLVSFNFILLFLPVAFLKPGPERRLLLILGGLVFMFSLALLSQFTFGVPYDLYRYLLPLALAFCIYTLGALARQYSTVASDDETGLSLWRIKSAVVLGTIVLGFQLVGFNGRWTPGGTCGPRQSEWLAVNLSRLIIARPSHKFPRVRTFSSLSIILTFWTTKNIPSTASIRRVRRVLLPAILISRDLKR